MASIGSLEVSLSLNASDFNGTVAQVDRNLKAMGSELQALRAKGTDYENSINGLSQKQNILARSFDAAGIKLQEQRRRYDELVASGEATEKQIERQANAVNQAQAQYNRLERELADVTEQLRIQSSQWTQAGQRMQEVGGKLTAVGNSMKNIGQNMSMYITAPLAAMGVGILKIGMDFDAQMSKVSAVSGATGGDFDALRIKAQDLGATTKFTATQVAEGMEYLALAGYNTNQILSATNGVLNLAAAGAMDLGMAADITTDVMSAFGMQAKEAGHAADIFAYAQANANTNVEQAGEAMKYLAPMANQMGWSMEEATAAVMKLADNGLKGSIAGQAFASSLGRLAKPTKQMRKTLDELNISFFDSNDNMKSLPDIIGHLEDKFTGLTMKQKSAAITTLFGAEAYKHWAILLESGSDTLAQYTKELENSDGTAQRMADTMVDNLAGSMLMLKSALEGLAIQFSDLIKDDIRALADWLTKMTGKFAELSEGTKKTILVVGALAAAIGPLIVVAGVMLASIGSIITSFGAVSLAIGQAGGVVALLTTKLAFLGPVFTALTGPIGLTIAAIGAVGTGLVVAYKKVDWFREGVQNIWEKIKCLTSDAFITISGFIKSYVNDAVVFATEIMDKFRAFWDENGKTIIGIVQLYFGQIRANIEAVMMVIKGVFEVVWPIITGVFKIAWETMKLTVGNTLDLILGIIQTVMKLIQGDWKGAWETIQQTVVDIMDNVKAYFQNVDLVQIGKDIIQGFIDGFGSMVEGVKTSASYLMDQIKEKFGEKFDELKTTITDWFTSIPGVIESKLTEWGMAISNWFTSLPANTTAKLDEWWTAISDWFSSVPERIFAKLSEWGLAILEWSNQQNEENKRQFAEWWNAIAEWFSSIPEKITSKLGEWGTAIKDWFTSIPGEIATKLSEWWDAISNWFIEAYEGITAKLSEWGKAIGDWFSEMPSNIGDWLSEWWTKISTWFSEIPEKITAKFEEWWVAIKDWFTSVPDKPEIKNMGKNMIDKVAEGNTEKKPELLDKLGKIIVDVALGALVVAGVALFTAGREIIKRLIDGIQEAKKSLETKMGELKDTIINKIKETNLLQVGKDIVSGLIKGMGSMITDVGTKAKELGQKVITSISGVLERRSPSRVMMRIGKDVGRGLAIGIDSTQDLNESAMKELGQLLIDATKSSQDEVTKIADDAEKERTKIQQESAKKKLEIENKLAVDLQKANNTISAKKKGATANDNIKIQQLKETANAKLIKLEQDTQDKFKKINDKAWADMVKKEESMAAERLTLIKRYIDDKKSTEELSLIDEANILEQSLSLFKEGTKERVEIQKAYQKTIGQIKKEEDNINKEYYDNVKKLNDEYIKEEERLTKVYEDEFDKRRDAYYSFAGIFDEVVQRDVSGSTLIAALQSQVTAFEDWQKNIAELSSKGINEGLLAELQAMGPKAGAEIAALNTLTEEQLAEYTELWKTKNEQARIQAEQELEGLKQNTEKQINELKIKTVEQLRIYQNEWRTSMIALKGNVKTEMAEMPNIGVFAVSGLIDGMMSKQGELLNAASSLAAIVASAFAAALDIHSPSRVMRGYGINIGEGLILGMNEMAGKVAGATKRLAKAVSVDGMNQNTSGNTSPSTTTTTTENNYHLTVTSPKPLDPYETARLSKNGWKEMGLQLR